MNNSNIANNNNISKVNGSNMSVVAITFGIILLAIIIIIAYIYYEKYNKYVIQDIEEKVLYKYVYDARKGMKEFRARDIPTSTIDNSYSINFWIYIDDFNYRLNEEKYILLRGRGQATNGRFLECNPGIYLDSNINDLIVDIQYQKPNNSDEYGNNKLKIENVPLQRWTNVHVSYYSRLVDVYIDGKLTNSALLPGNPIIINDISVFMTPNDGFGGYLSKIRWANGTLSPQEINARYAEGPKVIKDLLDILYNEDDDDDDDDDDSSIDNDNSDS